MIDNFFTKRLKCRKLTEEDMPLIAEWSNDNEAYGDFLSMEKFTHEDCLSRFESNFFWNDRSKTFLIEFKEDCTPIGTIQYWIKADNPKTAMVALKITNPELRRKGYGTEVQKAMIRELFKKYKFETVEMYTDMGNTAQQECLKKLDFENVGVQDFPDGKIMRKGYLFRLTKNRYENSGVHIYYYD